MKTIKIIFLLAAMPLLALSGCEAGRTADPAEEVHNIYHVRVTGKIPDTIGGTKVTFNEEGQLKWGNFETVGLLLGNDNSTSSQTSDTHLTVPVNSYGDGIFEGSVDFGRFTVNDIRGAAYPYDEFSFFYFNTNHRISITIGGSVETSGAYVQKQFKEGELNGNNLRLITAFGPGDIGEDDGTYYIDGKTFIWAHGVVRFNLFGTGAGMTADEKLLSITIHGDKSGGVGTIARQLLYNIDSGGGWLYNSRGDGTVRVDLEEPATLAGRSQEGGLKIFMAAAPYTINFQGDSWFEIKSTRATYRMPISASLVVSRGEVTRIGIDMSAAFPTPNELGKLSWINESEWTPISE